MFVRACRGIAESDGGSVWACHGEALCEDGSVANINSAIRLPQSNNPPLKLSVQPPDISIRSETKRET